MTSMSKVPAFHEESRMPPEDEVRAWMLHLVHKEGTLPPDKYWPKIGKEKYDEYKEYLKVNDDVRSASAQATGDASTAGPKTWRLYEFCQTKIRNVNSDTSGLTPDERFLLKDNKTPSDTLKRPGHWLEHRLVGLLHWPRRGVGRYRCENRRSRQRLFQSQLCQHSFPAQP